MKLHILSCVPDGAVYSFNFDGGVFTPISKLTLDRPMYAAIENGTMHILLAQPFNESSGYLTVKLANGEASTVFPTHGPTYSTLYKMDLR